MKNAIRFVLCGLVAVILFNSSTLYAYDETRFYLNGERLEFDVPPQIIDGITMIPMRDVFEALGAYVHWVPGAEIILAFRGQTAMMMRLGESELIVTDMTDVESFDELRFKIVMVVHGHVTAADDFIQFHEFDVVPQMINGRILIPLEAVSEALGVTVDLDGSEVNLTASEEFLNKPNFNQNFINEIIYFYDVTLFEMHESYQGGFINPASAYVPLTYLTFRPPSISGTGTSGLAIRYDNSLWGWGNAVMPLGEAASEEHRRLREDMGDLSTPIQLMDNVTAVATGAAHSIAIQTDGSLWVWGCNIYAQIGDGTVSMYLPIWGTYPMWLINNNRPLPVNIMDNAVYVAAGGLHSLAIKTDGSLWTWGFNSYGQLGNGTRQMSTMPSKIMENVVSVAAGYYHSLALQADGSLWTFGIGMRRGVDNLIPVNILEDVVYIAASFQGSAAVTSDGGLWLWGFTTFPDDIAQEDRDMPTRVFDDVIAAEITSFYTVALRSDNSLWAWGQGFDESPSKIMDDVVAITSGLALRADGSLWTLEGQRLLENVISQN